ncbi:uncharacterized protein PGTG_21701 [Puccinia graminis f. sp. tritici CRL 75-36-700-3]|uniref:Uncharacterized protein n=1 Tax=Puccinia graminis f. sp. tritici (strain CRL 75-36-700-3 / race SCCL) TaxID=418459 RepID=H6QS53_PUCGT|nr:uncharacterized protein PGTG_21701 [Puccinia graminis f. sp. tritici CRL 75-36-700-3]EHS63527.1 hypothetical protein PGTG_21701 [Puccinia graminis f. sp. tritici CRL 75-36-700-3]
MTKQTQPLRASEQELDSHTPSTTDPMDIKARTDSLKKPTHYNRCRRTVITSQGYCLD